MSTPAASTTPTLGDLQILVGLAERLRDDTLLDRDDLARRLGVSGRTVSIMVDRGDLPGPLLHTTGVARWSWPQVEQYLQARQGRPLLKKRGRHGVTPKPAATAAKGGR
jgi:hypothetical protein